MVHAYFAPVTPPPANNAARHGYCRCCVILWGLRYRYPPTVGVNFIPFEPRMFINHLRYGAPIHFLGDFGTHRINRSLPYGTRFNVNIFNSGLISLWNNNSRGYFSRLYLFGYNPENQVMAYPARSLFAPPLSRYILPQLVYWYLG